MYFVKLGLISKSWIELSKVIIVKEKVKFYYLVFIKIKQLIIKNMLKISYFGLIIK